MNQRLEYFATTPWVENTEFGEPWSIWLYADEMKDWQLVGHCQLEDESKTICEILNNEQYDFQEAQEFIKTRKKSRFHYDIIKGDRIMSWLGDAIGYLFFDKTNRKTADQIEAEYEMEKEAKLSTATKEFVKKMELLITSSELLNRPILPNDKLDVFSLPPLPFYHIISEETRNYGEFIKCIIESAKMSNKPIDFEDGGLFFGEVFRDFNSMYEIWIKHSK